jgi:hypothetical protein
MLFGSQKKKAVTIPATSRERSRESDGKSNTLRKLVSFLTLTPAPKAKNSIGPDSSVYIDTKAFSVGKYAKSSGGGTAASGTSKARATKTNLVAANAGEQSSSKSNSSGMLDQFNSNPEDVYYQRTAAKYDSYGRRIVDEPNRQAASSRVTISTTSTSSTSSSSSSAVSRSSSTKPTVSVSSMSQLQGYHHPSSATASSSATATTTTASSSSSAKNSNPLCCDKCDGKHPTDDCPYYKKPREQHPDAQRGKKMGGMSSLPGAIIRNARIVRQPGDGSCLFHSMSYGLKSGMSADRLRYEICQYIKHNPTLTISDTPLSEWIKWDSKLSCADYARRMSSGTWGGGIEMACTSLMYRCNVHVYERSTEGFKRISAFDYPENPETLPTVRVLYCGGVHYGTLRPLLSSCLSHDLITHLRM